MLDFGGRETAKKKNYWGTVHYVASQLFTANKLLGITSINTTSQNHTLRQLYPLTKHVLLLCAVFGNHYPLSNLRHTKYSRRSYSNADGKRKIALRAWIFNCCTYNWDC